MQSHEQWDKLDRHRYTLTSPAISHPRPATKHHPVMFKTIILAAFIAILSLTDLGAGILIALTDLQMDKILDMIAAAMRAFGEAIKAVWLVMAPALISYLAWRQHANNKAREKGQEDIKGKVEKVASVMAETPKPADTPGASAQNPIHLEIQAPPP